MIEVVSDLLDSSLGSLTALLDSLDGHSRLILSSLGRERDGYVSVGLL